MVDQFKREGRGSDCEVTGPKGTIIAQHSSARIRCNFLASDQLRENGVRKNTMTSNY